MSLKNKRGRFVIIVDIGLDDVRLIGDDGIGHVFDTIAGARECIDNHLLKHNQHWLLNLETGDTV